MDTGVARRRTRWQDEAGTWGRHVGVPVLAAIALLTAVSTLVGWLVVDGGGGALDRIDVRAAEDLAASRTSTLDAVTSAIDALASTATVSVLWLAAVVAFAWRTRRPAVPIFLVAAIGGEKLTYLLTTLTVDRPRPPVTKLGHT
ncbi:MAG TPA: hypothetical protein VHK88_09655, partial [Aquihabitans sp.]|nr:hypothetical protein [Aquihabitans sp.]